MTKSIIHTNCSDKLENSLCNSMLISKSKNGLLGKLFIVSAPAGAGKTTLVTELISSFSDIEVAVSYTTRLPRADEQEGVHYHFISHEQFQKKREAGDFLESIELHGNWYGSCRRTLQKKREEGIHLIMVIDTDGAEQVLLHIQDAITIFITVPSIEVLEQRLLLRKSETQDSLQKRLRRASEELLCAKKYQYVIMNDLFLLAFQTLVCIIVAEIHKQSSNYTV